MAQSRKLLLPWAVPFFAALLGAYSGVFLCGLSQQGIASASTVIATHHTHVHARKPVMTGTWSDQALDKFHRWRAALFSEVLLLYRELENETYGSLKNTTAETPRVEPRGNTVFDLSGAKEHMVPCPVGSLTRVGVSGDGGKLVCLDYVTSEKQECVVYSLGSAGQFDFEEGILKDTNCSVHTFDCTSQPKVLHSTRHFFHQICLAKTTKGLDGKNFMSFSDVTSFLGHKAVDLLKMDIEGWEYEVFTGLNSSSCQLPQQISFEAHRIHLYSMTDSHDRVDFWGDLLWARHQLSAAEMALFFVHLADLGYAAVNLEYNSGLYFDQCCSEFTLLRLEEPAHC